MIIPSKSVIVTRDWMGQLDVKDKLIHKARDLNVIASPNWQRLDIEKVKVKPKTCKLENCFK